MNKRRGQNNKSAKGKSRRKQSKKASQDNKKASFSIESLEPRILLSATWVDAETPDSSAETTTTDSAEMELNLAAPPESTGGDAESDDAGTGGLFGDIAEDTVTIEAPDSAAIESSTDASGDSAGTTSVESTESTEDNSTLENTNDIEGTYAPNSPQTESTEDTDSSSTTKSVDTGSESDTDSDSSHSIDSGDATLDAGHAGGDGSVSDESETTNDSPPTSEHETVLKEDASAEDGTEEDDVSAGVPDEESAEPLKIVLIDSTLDDVSTLRASVDSDAIVIDYDGANTSMADVLGQVETFAQGQNAQIESLSILSHGSGGQFDLGNEVVSEDMTADQRAAWQSLADNFTDAANIYAYGCNVVDGSGEGQDLLNLLSGLTGTEVFGSTDLTGAGGDWQLEAVSVGGEAELAAGITTELSDAALADYDSSLADGLPAGSTVTWDGEASGDDDFSNASNWEGDSAPGSDKTLVFNATSTDDAEFDASFGSTIGGLTLDAGYTGTVSLSQDIVIEGDLVLNAGQLDLNGHTITVTGNVTINGGDFDHETGTLQLTGGADQTISGNGEEIGSLTINKPSGTVTIDQDLRIDGNYDVQAGTVDATSATIEFEGYKTDINAGNTTFGNVVLDVSNTTDIVSDVNINGNLTIENASTLNGSTISVGGNIVSNDSSIGGTTTVTLNGTGDQSISGTGDVNNLIINKPSGTATFSQDMTLSGNFTHTAGTVDASSVTIEFEGYKTDIDANGITFNNVVLDVSNTTDFVSDLNINGDLTIQAAATLNGSNINVSGNVVSNDSSIGGTTTVTLNGTGDQSISGTGDVNNLVINKPSGTATFSQDMTLSGNFTHTAGTVDASSVTIEFEGYKTDIDANGITFNNVILDVSSTTDFVSDLNVDGDLTIQAAATFNGSNINVTGNVVSNDSSIGGTTTVTLNGTGDQSISGTGDVNNLVINKPSGTATFSQDMTLSGNFTHTSGTVDASSVTIEFEGYKTDIDANGITFNNVVLDVSSTTDFVSDLNVDGDLTIQAAATLNGSNINVTGNLVSNDSSIGGTTTVTLNGTDDQSISGTGDVNNLVIDKAAGTTTFATDMTLSGNFTHIAGTVDASSVTIEFKGYKTDIDASGITFGNVKLDVSGTTDFVSNLNVNGDLTVDNAATLNGGTINVSGNVTSNDTSISGSTNLTLNGTGNQSMAGSGDFNNLTINKPSGTVTFTENAVLTGDFTHTAGNVDAGSVTIEFEGYGTEIAAGSITFGDVVLDVSGTTDFANDLVIDGDVTVQNASTLNGSKIYASGSLTEVDSSYGGTTEFVIGSLPSSNDAPTANAGADQTVDEGSTVTLDASSSSDTDGDSLSYTWTQTAGPTVALSDTAAAQPNFTAPEGTSNTTLTFQVAVNDGTTTSYDTVTINVNADDDAPNASAGADQTVNEGTSVSLDASGSSDPEGQSMTYSWTQTGGPTVALSDASASQPSFTAPDVSTNTTLTFQVAVSDGTTTSYDTVNVDVTAGNTAPTANAGLDVTVNENELVTLGGGGTTPSGQIANWQFSENLDDSSASDLSATLQNGDGDEFTGSGTITFDGTDDMVRADAPELTGDYTTSIRIKPDATQNPWAGIYAATDETGATNHWNLQFDNKADRNIVIFHNGSNKWDTGIDLDDVAGDWHDVTIVRDGDTMSAYLDGALVKSGNWSVDPKGSADHLNIGGERTGSSDYLYTGEIDEIEIYNRALSDAERAAITTDAATGSDADGDSLTYTWTQTGGPTVSLSDSNASQPTFTAPEGISNSSLTFQVAVSDGTVTTYDTVTVTVNADDDAPTANAGMDQTVDEGASVSLDASASSDSEGQGLTYTWTQTSGTDVTLSDSGASQPTFTAPEGVANSTLTFQVAVSDGTTTSYDTVTITINADDDAPNASAGNDIIVNEGAAVALDAAGSTDPEGQGLTYTWTQTAGPTVALSDTADSQPTFTAPNVTSGTTLTFQVAVSDGTTTSYDTVDIVVNNTNTAADANAGIDQTVKEGSTVTLDGAGTSDADGDSLVLTWRQTDGPAVTLSDANAVQPTFTAPDVTEATTISFEVSVNDGSEITTDTVTITVEPQVEAEFVLTPIPDVTVDEGQSVTLRASASSANTIDFASGTITSYGGGQDVNATVSVEDTGSTLHLTGNGWKDLDFPYTVTENTILEFDFKVTETGEIHGIGFDTDDGISQNRTFQLHGTQDWGIGNYTADEVKEGEWIQVRIPVGEFYTGDFDKLFFVNDHDGGLRNAETFFSNVRVFESDALPDNLTYSWTQTGGPAVTLNNDTTSDLSFDTPDVDTQTTLTFQVEVSDGDVTKTDIVEVTVNPLPEPELLAFAGPNQSVQENSLVTLNGTANLGEAVAFQVDQLSSYGGSQDIDLDVSVEDSGTTLHLTGNGWKDMNFPYTVTENTVIEFDFKVTESGEIHGIGFDNDDALSENRTFQLHGTQDWGIGNYVAEDVEVGEWTRVRIPVGEFYTGDFDRLFFVSDHDGGGQNAESFFANLQVYEGDQTTENLTYTWTQTGGPTVALSDPNATQPTFTAPDGVTNSTLTFQLAVTDGKTTVFDTVEILVEATDAAPSASANGPANALVGEIVHLDATTSTDPEGQGLIFNWRQVSGPAVEMTGDDESIVNFAAPDVEDMTELVFEVAVSDGNSISYDTVTVSVTPTGLVVESSVVDAPGSTPTLPAAPSTPSEPNTEPDNNPSFEESVSTDNDILADDRQRSEAFDAINNGFVESPRDPIADVPGQTNQGSTPDSNPGSEPPVSVLRESDDELERNGTNGSTAPTDPREQHESRADSETTPRDGTGGLSDGRSPDIITNDHNDVRSGRNPSNGIESSAGPETATENLEESPWNGTEDLQLIDPMTGELDVMIDNELEENARASFLDSQAQLNEQKRTLQSQFDFEDEIVLPDSNVAFGVPGEEFTWDDQSSTLEQVFEQVVEGSTVPLVPLTDGSNPVSKDDEDEESTEENAMLRRRAVAESAKQASRPEIQSAGVSHEDNGTRDQENTKHSSGTNGFFANLWLAIRGVTFGPRNSQQERDSNSNR